MISAENDEIKPGATIRNCLKVQKEGCGEGQSRKPNKCLPSLQATEGDELYMWVLSLPVSADVLLYSRIDLSFFPNSRHC